METILSWFRNECMNDCSVESCTAQEITILDREAPVAPLGRSSNSETKVFGITVDVGDGRYSYRECDLLGAGNFGRVFVGRVTSSAKSCAIKHVSKANPLLAAVSFDRAAEERAEYVRALRQESTILKTFNHANIVGMLDSFEDFRNFFIVLELLQGGKLKDYLFNATLCPKLFESDVAYILQNVLTGVQYVHGQHYCHRDLKCDNVMFLNQSPIPQNSAKLIDFGLTCECRPGQRLKELCGTPLYMAPQVIENLYDLKADVWSCGVILYMLLCGKAPFNGDSAEVVMQQARRGNFSLSGDDWYYITDSAKDLIRGLMAYDPKDRYTADEALSHTWIRQHAPGSSWRDLKHARWRLK